MLPSSAAISVSQTRIGRTKAKQLGPCDRRSSRTRQEPARKLRRGHGIPDRPQRFRSVRQSAAHRAWPAAAHAARAATPQGIEGCVGGRQDSGLAGQVLRPEPEPCVPPPAAASRPSGSTAKDEKTGPHGWQDGGFTRRSRRRGGGGEPPTRPRIRYVAGGERQRSRDELISVRPVASRAAKRMRAFAAWPYSQWRRSSAQLSGISVQFDVA